GSEQGPGACPVCLAGRRAPAEGAAWAAAGRLWRSPENPESIPPVRLAWARLERYPAFDATVEEASCRAVGYRSKGTLEVLLAGEAGRELSTLIALHHGLGLPTEALRLEEALEMEPALSRQALAVALLPYEASVD